MPDLSRPVRPVVQLFLRRRCLGCRRGGCSRVGRGSRSSVGRRRGARARRAAAPKAAICATRAHHWTAAAPHAAKTVHARRHAVTARTGAPIPVIAVSCMPHAANADQEDADTCEQGTQTDQPPVSTGACVRVRVSVRPRWLGRGSRGGAGRCLAVSCRLVVRTVHCLTVPCAFGSRELHVRAHIPTRTQAARSRAGASVIRLCI